MTKEVAIHPFLRVEDEWDYPDQDDRQYGRHARLHHVMSHCLFLSLYVCLRQGGRNAP